jgi:hypothetical protein
VVFIPIFCVCCIPRSPRKRDDCPLRAPPVVKDLGRSGYAQNGGNLERCTNVLALILCQFFERGSRTPFMHSLPFSITMHSPRRSHDHAFQRIFILPVEHHMHLFDAAHEVWQGPTVCVSKKILKGMYVCGHASHVRSFVIPFPVSIPVSCFFVSHLTSPSSHCPPFCLHSGGNGLSFVNTMPLIAGRFVLVSSIYSGRRKSTVSQSERLFPLSKTTDCTPVANVVVFFALSG